MSEFGLQPVDINQAVTAAMNFEYKQQYRMQVTASTEQVQISAYGSLKSLFGDFQTKLTALNTALNGVAFQATASDTNVITNINLTNNNIAAMSHTVEVSQLAKSQINTSGYVSSNTTDLNTQETLTFTDTNNNTVNINVVNGDTLQSVRDKINNNNLGLNATVIASTDINGNNQYSLVVTSQSGTKNQVTITGDTNNVFNFTQTTAAADAKFKFDGHDVVRSTNNINDVIDGINFTLSNTNAGSPATISVSSNTLQLKSGVKQAINDFVTSYNQLMSFLDANQVVTTYNKQDDNYNMEKNTDFNLIKSKLQKVAQATFSGNIKSLFSIGIKIDAPKTVTDAYDQRTGADKISPTSYGQFKIDDSKLDGYLTDHFSDIKSLFTDSSNGLIKELNTTIDKTIMGGAEYNGIIYGALGTIQKKLDRTNNELDKQQEKMNTMHDKLVDDYIKTNIAIEKYKNIFNYISIQFDSLNNMLKK